jgi:hypothetical protein
MAVLLQTLKNRWRQNRTDADGTVCIRTLQKNSGQQPSKGPDTPYSPVFQGKPEDTGLCGQSLSVRELSPGYPEVLLRNSVPERAVFHAMVQNYVPGGVFLAGRRFLKTSFLPLQKKGWQMPPKKEEHLPAAMTDLICRPLCPRMAGGTPGSRNTPDL